MNGQEIVTKCESLRSFWARRNKKLRDWYSQIEMIDTLAQKDMESFVGNDPRSSYNLVLSMLNQKIPHRIPPEDLGIEEIAPAAELSRLFDTAWDDIFSRHRRRGRYWLRDLIGYLLATGWYAVFSTVSQDGSRCIAEIWNPASVYQTWDDDLVECAHIFQVNEVQARRLAARNSWDIAIPSGGYNKITIYDLWWLEGVSAVYNAIAINGVVVKDATREGRFSRIPIFTSPIGGLPDTGELASRGNADRWKEELGQSIIATNENIYNYWNKWWTFSTQLLRDTAQARTYEKTRSGKQIIRPEDWNKRGAHFKMAPEDEIGFIAPPPIPMELRSAQLDMEAMMQRGGPSWAMFGSVQQQMTSYVMSQVASSANQIAKPYHQGIVDCITDIDNFWLYLMSEFNYKPYGKGLPSGLPAGVKVTADYELRIPGDLVQRATTARIMNPAFELSEEKVMEELFPEIKNPAEEIAKTRAGKARKHPLYATITLIEGFREEARLLREVGDIDAAVLYEKAADLAEASMTPEESSQPSETGGISPPPARPEVMAPPAAQGPISTGGE